MTVSALKASIISGDIPHILVFTGDEWKVQNIYMEQISKRLKTPIKRLNTVVDVLSKVNKSSLLKQSYIYVVSDDKEYTAEEQLQKAVAKEIGDNYLIIKYSTVDKRTKFFKTVDAVEFEPLTDEMLVKYIKQQVAQISDKNCATLIDICEHDYGRILLEIDKIRKWQAGYSKDKQQETPFEGCFLRLLNDGEIYRPPKDAIFDFVDAVLDKDLSAFDLLLQCIAVGEAVMVMLSVLYTNARALYQVQTCKSADMQKATGLTSWQINNARKHLNIYSDEDLLYVLSVIRKCEKGIKMGIIEEQFAMDYILIQIM